MSSNESPILRLPNVVQDQEAPPIPPRKSAATNDFNRPLKPQPAPPAPEKIIDSPQLPEHKPKPNFLSQDDNFDDDEEDPICGPAETITGEFKLNTFVFI